MQIDIILDPICPWCFIGKRRFERALSMRPQGDLNIRWLPYQLNPTMPAGGMDRRQYLAAKFGGAERAERQYDRLRATGREVGIDFAFEDIHSTPNTIDSHRLIHFSHAEGQQSEVVEALFQAYFLNGADLGDIDVLTEIGAASGLDRAALGRYLASDEDRSHIVELDENMRRIGISGVPCFIVEDSYAISGAQSPEIFHQIFDLVRQEGPFASGRSAAE
jgi:predicted DsbA family dithiol-disulfide isomerase